MRGALAAVLLSACATAAVSLAPTSPDRAGAVSADASAPDASLASSELSWFVAHLADDPDPANPRETDAVRRLSALGPPALRAVVEVFRVGDARRAPFARRVFERQLRARCQRDEGRVTRTLAQMQGRTWDGGATARWPEGDAPWSQSAMERAYQWIDAGASCAE